jgi:hypothetical protein
MDFLWHLDCQELFSNFHLRQHIKVKHISIKGENTVLFLQVARFLLKSLKDLQKGKRLTPTVMYLE